MCGPLVMTLSKHRFRNYYFFGRLLSYTLVGAVAGLFGAVIHYALKDYYIQAVLSLVFGFVLIWIGVFQILNLKFSSRLRIPRSILKIMSKIQHKLTLWMMKDLKFPTFFFGFFTVFLPCGQTMLVFSACALSLDLYVGLFNGFMFGLLTSPSLFFAMQAKDLMHYFKDYYHSIMGFMTLIVGFLSLFRGLSELEIIPHLVLNPGVEAVYHIVLF